MNLINLIWINLQKLKGQTRKAMHLVVPIAFVVLVTVVVASQVDNFRQAADEAIFGTVDEQARLIELTKERPEFGGFGGGRMMSFEQDSFSESDAAAIESIDHVQDTMIPVPVPVSGESEDLFASTSVNLTQLTGLEATFAPLYTDQDFGYTAGEPIPIVLSANALQTTVEDWGGSDRVEINFSREAFQPGSGGREALMNQSPVRVEAIDYDKSDLIGTTFTMSFGGLAPNQTFETEQTTSGIAIVKRSQEDIDAEAKARADAVAPYWDVDQLSTPLTYTFEVVGVTEEAGGFRSYVPAAFASELMQSLIEQQQNARTDAELPNDLLTTTFSGLTYDGLNLSGQTSGFAGIRLGGGPGGGLGGADHAGEDGTTTAASVRVTIPGLVIGTDRSTTGATEVLGVVDDPTVFDQAVRSASELLLQIDDVANRATVVGALNNAGYAYQDTDDLAVFDELQSTLSWVSLILALGFVVFSGMIIVFTMGKFVSESRKEIGIFRAIGMTSSQIRSLFVSQALLYALLGAGVGALAGVLGVLLSAGPAKAWFDGLIGSTVYETFNVVQQSDPAVFSGIDWQSLGLYGLVLLAITILVAWLPAGQAARMSPVEAIREE